MDGKEWFVLTERGGGVDEDGSGHSGSIGTTSEERQEARGRQVRKN